MPVNLDIIAPVIDPITKNEYMLNKLRQHLTFSCERLGNVKNEDPLTAVTTGIMKKNNAYEPQQD